MSQAHTVTVKILDKDYQVACPEEEVEALKAAGLRAEADIRMSVGDLVPGLDGRSEPGGRS